MNSSVLFDSWKQWKICFKAGVSSFFWGFMRIISCIVLGILSVIVWIWKMASLFVEKNPKVALGGFIIIGLLIWLFTFVSMRSRAVGAENQRDQIAWNYQQFKESHGYE